MKYTIKPEFLDYWGSDATEETPLTRSDIENICRGWSVTVDSVLNQLNITDDDGNDWNYIVSLMDDDIREAVHADLAPCTEEDFLQEYRKRHFEKYHDEFVF